MRTPKLVFDNGTPACLPRWAREEMVRLRLREHDLHIQVGGLAAELARARDENVPRAVAAAMSSRRG